MVYYACYGSNLLLERFMCYIRGGRIKGSSKYNIGCRDNTPPIEDKPYIMKRKLYFAGEFKQWGNGSCTFVGTDEEYIQPTISRMYKITKEQFLDIVYQENSIPYSEELIIDWDKLYKEKELVLFPKSPYGRLMLLEFIMGYPVLTFTWVEPIKCNYPSKEYMEVINKGLRETINL